MMPWEEGELTPKEWRRFIDESLWGGATDSNAYSRLDERQKWLMQEINRSKERCGMKHKKVDPEGF